MTNQEKNSFKFTPIIKKPIGFLSKNINNFDCNYWIDKCYKYRNKNPYSETRSNVIGYQSSSDLQNHPEFYPLLNIILKEINMTTPITNNHISGMWINISPQGAWNLPHTHPPSGNIFYSGVFYLKTPKNCGDLSFLNPLDINQAYHHHPSPKDLVLFAGNLPHLVGPNLSNEDRISIAFNYE